MATRCPRCGNWIEEGKKDCDQCGYSPGSKREFSKSNVQSNPF